jgi:hypothetical protein
MNFLIIFESNCNMKEKERNMGNRWFLKIIFYALLILFFFAVLEISSYAYLRIFEGYDGNHLMTYQFDDYKNIQLTPNYINTNGVAHNSEGFRRSEETSMEKSNGTYRIFIMGGSTAYGLGSLSKYGKEKYGVIRNNETIDYYIEHYLNNKSLNLRVEVINAAITSDYSHHHLIYLNQKILKFNPDMIIFIDGWNDYYPYTKDFDQFRDYAYQERVHHFMEEPTVDAWMSYTGWWLFRKSHFVHVAALAVNPIWLQIKMIGHKRSEMNVNESLENLRINAKNNFVKMVERNSLILAHEHVVGVFTVQPETVFQQSKVFTELEQNIFDEINTVWAKNYVEFKNKARPIVMEDMTEATNSTGSIFIDMTDIFGGMKEDAYTDYCHLTPMGNKRFAEYLGERLVPIIVNDSERMNNESFLLG